MFIVLLPIVDFDFFQRFFFIIIFVFWAIFKMRESEIVKNNSFVEAIERLVSPIVGEMNTDNKFGKQ